MTQETPERPKTPVVWVVQESVKHEDTDLVSIHQTPDGATDAARTYAAKHRVTDWRETDTTARLCLSAEDRTITVTQEKLQR
jgi:hypothetical protein